MDFNQLLTISKEAALLAGKEIVRIYESGDFSVEAKSDSSPLTLADKASHEAIVAKLSQTGIPILSEEGKEIQFEERSKWDYFWMIDPLDGTKEFIKRNGEFTVNIALIHEGKPILGVVFTPVLNELFYAVRGEGTFKEVNGTTKKLQVNTFSMKDTGLKVVASRSHMSEETALFIDSLPDPVIVSKGSSLKLLMIAEGQADVYPRFAPTMEWDTAAAQIIVEEAGGRVFQKHTSESVTYNKVNLLNPHFMVVGKNGTF